MRPIRITRLLLAALSVTACNHVPPEIQAVRRDAAQRACVAHAAATAAFAEIGAAASKRDSLAGAIAPLAHEMNSIAAAMRAQEALERRLRDTVTVHRLGAAMLRAMYGDEKAKEIVAHDDAEQRWEAARNNYLTKRKELKAEADRLSELVVTAAEADSATRTAAVRYARAVRRAGPLLYSDSAVNRARSPEDSSRYATTSEHLAAAIASSRSSATDAWIDSVSAAITANPQDRCTAQAVEDIPPLAALTAPPPIPPSRSVRAIADSLGAPVMKLLGEWRR